ncbi:hypothetical protein [Kribbella sp. NPDC051718]|uniref:hypothetical protein n=1 Tax=Kribbella sp. NPDC051718 TaxID=3155168 RepID=UPI0034332BC9
MRRVAPALGLAFLAPFVGEFLLGNLTLGELGIGLLLAPMYGAGALLIREVTRRTGRGWPTMALLATAYALIEEGPIDQLLWNDSYAGQDLLHGDSYLPAVGMSVELTLAIIALHAVWSISVPIAIIETLAGPRRTTPWLRTPGLVVTALLYVAGGVFVFFGNYSEEHFLASPAQLIGVAVVIVALVVLAFRPCKPVTPIPGRAPAPLMVGVGALVATSAYLAPPAFISAGWYEWPGVIVGCVVAGLGLTLIPRWSRQDGWGQVQVFALAAGATLTYTWVAFPTRPESGGSPTVDLIGNAIFGLVAVLVLMAGVRRLNPNQRQEWSASLR